MLPCRSILDAIRGITDSFLLLWRHYEQLVPFEVSELRCWTGYQCPVLEVEYCVMECRLRFKYGRQPLLLYALAPFPKVGCSLLYLAVLGHSRIFALLRRTAIRPSVRLRLLKGVQLQKLVVLRIVRARLRRLLLLLMGTYVMGHGGAFLGYSVYVLHWHAFDNAWSTWRSPWQISLGTLNEVDLVPEQL